MKEPPPKSYLDLLAEFLGAARQVADLKRPSVAQLLRKQNRRHEARRVTALVKAVHALDKRINGME